MRRITAWRSLANTSTTDLSTNMRSLSGSSACQVQRTRFDTLGPLRQARLAWYRSSVSSPSHRNRPAFASAPSGEQHTLTPYCRASFALISRQSSMLLPCTPSQVNSVSAATTRLRASPAVVTQQRQLRGWTHPQHAIVTERQNPRQTHGPRPAEVHARGEGGAVENPRPHDPAPLVVQQTFGAKNELSTQLIFS